jgi:hypothetical protein
MRWLTRAIMGAGAATLALLLWRFSPATVWADVSKIGVVGMIVVLAFQIFDHLLNALGWRFAFAPQDAAKARLDLLVRARVAGDGVNYLTPSGSIAGELIRPGMLGDVLPQTVKETSVVIAKFAQALSQAVFIICGLAVVALARFDLVAGRELLIGAGGALLLGALVALSIFLLTYQGPKGGLFWKVGGERLQGIRSSMRGYLRAHPGRFALSVLGFALGYGWGLIEVLLICRFMGVGIDPLGALAVETLSNVVDSLFFMVPAKLGTQEAGKTAIFAGLGYPPATGLAFGLIRHTRELVWASAGFALYALTRPKLSPGRPGGSAEPRAAL